MAEQRLPIVNEDDGVWGDIIRQFLLKEHYNADADLNQATSKNGGHKTITIQPGTATAGTAPLKFMSGTLLTTAEAGAIEFASNTLYFTPSTTRDTVVLANAVQTLANKTLTTPTLGVATATTINKVTITAPATSATLTIPDGVTLTGPAVSGTVMTLGNTETITGVKTFGSAGAVGRLRIAGTTSGTTILNASATASGTLTLPAATDTLVGKATVDILTNKTLDNTTVATVKAANFTIQDGTDTTKQAKFLASSITTLTTRTYTLPDISGTLTVAGVGSILVAAPTGVAATDTAAIQAAHDALPSGGGMVMLQGGIYALTATGVTFTKKTYLKGLGAGNLDTTAQTLLFCNSTTATAITCNVEGCVIEDFFLSNNSAGPVTSGTGIRMQKAHHSRINRVFIYNFYDNIKYEAGNHWSLRDTNVISPTRYGVLINNSDNNDSGDMLIDGCWFDMVNSGGHNATSAVRWETGSGLRLANTKFNGAQTYHYATHIDVNFDAGSTATVNSADIFIQNCSIENPSTTGISIATRSGSSYTLNEVIIQGNEFMSNPTGISIGEAVNDVIVSGNTFLNASTSTGITILSNAGPVTVGTNRFKGTTTPINIGATVNKDTKVAVQHLNGDGVVVVDGSASGSYLHTAQVDYKYNRAVDWTVTTTQTTMWTLSVANFFAGEVTVTITGLLNNVGAFVAKKRVLYSVDGSGDVTLTTLETTSHGTSNVVITLTTGTNTIAVKLSSSDNNSVAGGVADIDVRGYLSQFKVGA